MEKFHFNWEMDSFTSWLGVLGQCSTMLNGCQVPLRGGCSRKGAPSNAECSGTSEDSLVSRSGWLTTMPSPLSSPNVLQPKLYLSPAHKEWVHFTVPLQHFFRANLVHISFLVHLYHCSIPTGQRQGPQLKCLPYSNCRRSKLHKLFLMVD